MTPKQKAAQIYDQYWSAVSKRPASNKDPLPDIRPLIEKAIIEAEEAGAKSERATIGYQLGLLRGTLSESEGATIDKIVGLLAKRARSES